MINGNVNVVKGKIKDIKIFVHFVNNRDIKKKMKERKGKWEIRS
jgi:hypothetical protein